MWHLVCNRSTHTKLNMIGVENRVARWRLTLACRLCVYRNSRMQFYCHIDKRTFKTYIVLRFPLFTCKIPTATNSQILKGIRAFEIKFSSHLMNGNEFSGRKQLMYDHLPDILHRLWSTFLEIKTINRQTIWINKQRRWNDVPKYLWMEFLVNVNMCVVFRPSKWHGKCLTFPMFKCITSESLGPMHRFLSILFVCEHFVCTNCEYVELLLSLHLLLTHPFTDELLPFSQNRCSCFL